MKLCSRLFIFLVCFAFLGFSFSKIANASSFNLSGKVTDQSNTAISNTTITVTDSSTGTVAGTIITDSNGNYSLSVQQGTYNVTATPPSSSGFQNATFSNQSITSDTVLNFTLVPLLTVVTVSGHVTDLTGAGIGGVNMRFCTGAGCDGLVTADTDSSGFYSVQLLSGSDYTVTLNRIYGYTIQSSNTINVTQDTTFDVHVPTTYVTFHVQNQTQTPVVGASVTGRLNSQNFGVQTSLGTLSFVVTTDTLSFGVGTNSSGDGVLTTFPVALSYNVTPPDNTLLSTSGSQSITQDTTIPITLANAPVERTVSGHVTDPTGAGISGVIMRFCTDFQCDGLVTTNTDSSGFYSVQLLSGTDYTLLLRNLYGYDIQSSNVVNVTQDATFDIHVPTTFVTFHVQNQTQMPVSGATITGTLNDSGFSVQTSLGSFSYTVTPDTHGFGVGTNSTGDAVLTTFPVPLSYTVFPPDNTLLSTSGSQSISQDITIPITLTSAPVERTISGHVTDPSGAGVGGVTMRFCTGTGCNGLVTTSTDSSGFYSVQILSNTDYTVTLSHIYGFDIQSSSPTNISDDTTLDFHVPTTFVTFHVQDQNQTPLAGVLVSGTLNESQNFSIQTTAGSMSFNVTRDTHGFGVSTNSSGDAILTTFPVSLNYNVLPPNNTPFAPFSSSTNVTQDLTQVISLQYNHVSPTTTINLTNQYADGTYTDPTTVTFSATAASGYTVANTYYKIDSGSQQTYTAPFTVTGSGSHTITYWSVDNTGVQETANTKTFTITEAYDLSGIVYVDTNQNGTLDQGEQPYAGAIVTLNDGRQVVTDATGKYDFPNTEAGSYVDTLTIPNGYIATTTNPANIVLTANTTQNFGIVIPTHTLTGNVYNDENQNGVKDSGELGYVGGAIITLSNGQTSTTATTDQNGNYSFQGLTSGTYTETLTVPNGYTATTTNPVINLPITTDTTQNFGIYSRPHVGTITVNPNPVLINTSVTATAPFTDADATDTHTAQVDWNGSGTFVPCATVTEPNGSTPGSVSCSLTSGYSAANIYSVTIKVLDNDGASDSTTNSFVSVYAPTPSGKFAAGQGYVSPVGTIAQNPAISTGLVQLALSYKYNGNMPAEQKQFMMTFSNNITYSATSITSLVISNGVGTLTGSGTFSNSNTVYNFLVIGSQTNNTIRIQITDPNNNNAVIYDIQPGASNTAIPTTPVTGPQGQAGHGTVVAN